MQKKFNQNGNVLFYVFMAIGLMAALTYAFTKDSRENFASQSAVGIAESLYAQVNTIKSAVQQCVLEFPEGGIDPTGVTNFADLDRDGIIDAANDNPNLPYPLKPSDVLNPNARAGFAAAANDHVRNLTCVGAPEGEARMFQGASNQGRFLPPPPGGFPEWTYMNNTDGVYIQMIAPTEAAAIDSLQRLRNKFNTCQAEINFDGCGTRCFTAWILRVTTDPCL